MTDSLESQNFFTIGLACRNLISNSSMLDMSNLDDVLAYQSELNSIIPASQTEILGFPSPQFLNFLMLQRVIQLFQFSDFIKNLQTYLFWDFQKLFSRLGMKKNLQHLNNYFAFLANLRTSSRDIQDFLRSASWIRSSVSFIDSGVDNSIKSITSSNNSFERTFGGANTPRKFFSLIMVSNDLLVAFAIYSNDNKEKNDLSNQKAASNEMAFGRPTNLPIGAPDKLTYSIANQESLSRGFSLVGIKIMTQQNKNMFKKITKFIKYHNAFAIGFTIIFIGFSTALAVSPELREELK